MVATLTAIHTSCSLRVERVCRLFPARGPNLNCLCESNYVNKKELVNKIAAENPKSSACTGFNGIKKHIHRPDKIDLIQKVV